jgi:hypothetical protein
MSSEVWLPIATLVLGIVLSQGATWLNRKWELKQEREERVNTFQRESIIEAQDMTEKLFALHQEAKLTNIHEPRLMVNPQAVYSPAILIATTQTVLRVSTLRARITDQQLVSLLVTIEGCSVSLGGLKEDHKPGDTEQMSKAILQFNERAGQVLPELY